MSVDKLKKKSGSELKRSQVLRGKFFQLKDSLPKHIVDLFDNAHRLPEGKRAGQTKIISDLFDKDESGKRWVLNINKPMFTESKLRYHMGKWESIVSGAFREIKD